MKAKRRDCLILEDGTIFHIGDIVDVLYYIEPFKARICGIETSTIEFDCSKEFKSHHREFGIDELKSIRLLSRKDNIFEL